VCVDFLTAHPPRWQELRFSCSTSPLWRQCLLHPAVLLAASLRCYLVGSMADVMWFPDRFCATKKKKKKKKKKEKKKKKKKI
jgi:hypothetical protein